MDFIPIIKDSIDTSISMKLYKNREEASKAHIFNSKLVKFSMSKFKEEVENFDSERLQKSALKAYPVDNRPRGNADITSVKYHQKQIKNKKGLQPIWIHHKNNKYTLLDGVHRIVANYIENKSTIMAYVIS